MNLCEVKQKLEEGPSAPDVFGDLKGTTDEMLEAARNRFRTFAKACHPDMVADPEKESAAQIFKQLRETYNAITDQIRNGVYGKVPVVPAGQAIGTVKSKTREYTLLTVIATGEVARIYKGFYIDSNGEARYVAVKIALSEKDNALIENEQTIINKLNTLLTPQTAISLPKVIDKLITDDEKAGTVLELVDGYDFHQLLDHPLYQDGLRDSYHIGWVLERQLSLLGYLHKNGILHGNIEPSHLMLVPHNHNIILLDFCFALDHPSKDDRVHIFTPNYSAPEIQSGARPHPAMDMYGVGKCMLYLMKGDVKNGRIPKWLPAPYAKLIRQMINPEPSSRAGDAWKMAYELVDVRKNLGSNSFTPLPV